MSAKKRLSGKRLEAIIVVLEWCLAGMCDDAELADIGEDIAGALEWARSEETARDDRLTTTEGEDR